MAAEMVEESFKPACVVCVGMSAEELAAVMRAFTRPAVVVLATDVASAHAFLDGRGWDALPRPPTHTVHERGPLVVDEQARTATWYGGPLELSAHEFDLLTVLVSDAGRAWTFAELSERVWRSPYLGDAEVVISAVKRLRRRLAVDAAGLRIDAVRGVGFRLSIAEAVTAIRPL